VFFACFFKTIGILQYPIVFRERASNFLWNKVLLCFWVGHQNGPKSRKFWVSYNFLIRTQKNFQAKIRTFLKILFLIFWKKLKTFSIFFSPKESLDQDLSFGFCFIKIGRLESTFWGGVPLLGGGLWPGDEKISKIKF